MNNTLGGGPTNQPNYTYLNAKTISKIREKSKDNRRSLFYIILQYDSGFKKFERFLDKFFSKLNQKKLKQKKIGPQEFILLIKEVGSEENIPKEAFRYMPQIIGIIGSERNKYLSKLRKETSAIEEKKDTAKDDLLTDLIKNPEEELKKIKEKKDHPFNSMESNKQDFFIKYVPCRKSLQQPMTKILSEKSKDIDVFSVYCAMSSCFTIIFSRERDVTIKDFKNNSFIDKTIKNKFQPYIKDIERLKESLYPLFSAYIKHIKDNPIKSPSLFG